MSAATARPQDPSMKAVLLRLPVELAAWLKESAQESRRSVNQQAICFLEHAKKREDAQEGGE